MAVIIDDICQYCQKRVGSRRLIAPIPPSFHENGIIIHEYQDEYEKLVVFLCDQCYGTLDGLRAYYGRVDP